MDSTLFFGVGSGQRTASLHEGHGDRKGQWVVVGTFFGQHQNLHRDGTWQHHPVHPDTGEWTGYFPGLAEAEEAMRKAGPPTERIDRPTSRKCPRCSHIHDAREAHECPSPEYLALREALVREACEDREAHYMNGCYEGDDVPMYHAER